MPTLNDAIAAIKAGRRAEGRTMLSQVLLIEPNNVNALLWMTEVAETIEERRSLLRRILVVDPNNAVAQKGLEVLGPVQKSEASQQDTSPTLAVKLRQVSSASEPTIPSIAEATRKCPYCAEIVKAEATVCRYCGRDITSLQSVTPKSIKKTSNAFGYMILTGVFLVVIAIAVNIAVQQNYERDSAAARILGENVDEQTHVVLTYATIIAGVCGVGLLLVGAIRGFEQLGSHSESTRQESTTMQKQRSKRIVFLGWGSLYWNPRNLGMLGEWRFDGPDLPIEFARVSKDGRLTLVIYPSGNIVNSLWIESIYSELRPALLNLQSVENTPDINNIGFVDLTDNTSNSRILSQAQLDNIWKWARQEQIDAVIWTDLKPRWPMKTTFGSDSVLRYLRDLKEHAVLQEAEKYIRFAPSQIRTPLRSEIEKAFGWTPLSREALSDFRPRGLPHS